MGEVKQTNFRIDQATADAFRKFCDQNGMSQAQGFDHIMQIVEMDRAKAVAPGRATEIEGFEKSVKDIMAAYLYSIEINQNAEGRIREQFSSDLVRKDKTIDDLRQKAERLQAEKEAAETVAAEAIKAKEEAEKHAATAERFRASAEKTAGDKQTIADTLAAKLAEAEKKANGYDELRASLSASEAARKAAEQRVRDAERDAAEAARDAARTAEKDKEEAVRKVSDALREQISSLKDELRVSRSETDSARRDAEIAKTAAVAELSEAHRIEVSEIRAKLDGRTDDLMQARQEIGALQLRLQAAQAEIEAMKAKK